MLDYQSQGFTKVPNRSNSQRGLKAVSRLYNTRNGSRLTSNGSSVSSGAPNKALELNQFKTASQPKTILDYTMGKTPGKVQSKKTDAVAMSIKKSQYKNTEKGMTVSDESLHDGTSPALMKLCQQRPKLLHHLSSEQTPLVLKFDSDHLQRGGSEQSCDVSDGNDMKFGSTYRSPLSGFTSKPLTDQREEGTI